MPEGGTGIFLDGGVPLRLWDTETPNYTRPINRTSSAVIDFNRMYHPGKRIPLKLTAMSAVR